MPVVSLSTRSFQAAFVAVTLGSSGCASFFAVKGPPRVRDGVPANDCTTRYTAPIVDTIAGAIPAALLIGIVAANSSDPEDKGNRGPALGASVALTALAAASATYGYMKVSSCREFTQHTVVSAAFPIPARAPSREGRATPGATPALHQGLSPSPVSVQVSERD